MITTAFGFIIIVLLAQLCFCQDVAAYNERRELQSIWDLIPGITNIPSDPCDALAFIFESQVQQGGFNECNCTEERDTVSLTCTREEVICDNVETGVQDIICHEDTFTALTSNDGFSFTNPKEFSITACANYNPVDQVPDWLLQRQICLVYSISVSLIGIELDQCGVTVENITGRSNEVCKCSRCEGETNPWEIGLGFDCEVDIFGAVILQECIPITILSLAVFPQIRSINAEDTPPPLNVTTAPPVQVDDNDTPTQAPSGKIIVVTNAPSMEMEDRKMPTELTIAITVAAAIVVLGGIISILVFHYNKQQQQPVSLVSVSATPINQCRENVPGNSVQNQIHHKGDAPGATFKGQCQTLIQDAVAIQPRVADDVFSCLGKNGSECEE